MDARQRLLDAAIDHVAANGVADLSLRGLAEALGTSHRMLIYHFGSKDGLFVAVVQEMERRQRAVIADVIAAIESRSGQRASSGEKGQGEGGPAGAGDIAYSTAAMVTREVWRGLSDPAMWPHERLFFELYGRALQGDERARPLLEGIVTIPLEQLTEWGIQRGESPDVARARARLGLAVFRGLLLDLLATGDSTGVDAALEQFVAMFPPGV